MEQVNECQRNTTEEQEDEEEEKMRRGESKQEASFN